MAAPLRPDPALERLERWRRAGRQVGVWDRRLFVRQDGAADAPALLLLHGFPTCSWDFHRVLPELAARFRVVAHDHLGFGLSEKPAEASYSLFEQADLAVGLWRQLGVRRGHLVAHDYGTSVATELLARQNRGLLPLELLTVTLSNGSVLLELARLRLTQRLLRHPWTGPLLARLVGRRFFKARLRRLWGHRRPPAEDDLEVLWEALVRDGGREVLPVVSRYLDERVRFRERWVGALRESRVPLHLLWAREDPVAVPAIAEELARLAPAARLTWLGGVGHFPMLEAPEEWAEGLLAGLG